MKSGGADFFLRPQGRPKGRVLLLHGFSASPFEVRECGLHLQKKGYLVYGPRLAGHASDRADFDKAGMREWILGAEKAFAFLRHGREKIILIGHSAGAVLAAMLAAKYPEKVKSLVMGAPAFKLKGWKAPLSLFPPLRWIMPSLNFPGLKPDSKFWTQSYATDRLAELIHLGRLGRKSVLRLKLPLLLLQAHDDDLISRPFNEALFKKIPSSNKRLILYKTGEHNVFHHHNPLQNKVFHWLDSFLAG